MKILGLWPNSKYIHFYFILAYHSYQMIMEFLYLALLSKDFSLVLMNLLQNLCCTNMTMRLILLRLWIKNVNEIIQNYKHGFSAKDFTDEEVEILFLWNAKAKFWMKLMLFYMLFTTISLNFIPLFTQMGASKY